MDQNKIQEHQSEMHSQKMKIQEMMATMGRQLLSEKMQDQRQVRVNNIL